MKVFASDHFVLPLPEKHRFPMTKYRLLRERMEAHPLIDVLEAPSATDAQLLTSHCPDYLRRLRTGNLDPKQIRRLGFPYSPELVERCRRSVGATYAACRVALECGTSANLAGGTHHAFYDQPEGFCVFNDSVVALRVLMAEGLIGKALVIDCDVHQGNGTASLTSDDARIVTFSMHGAHNFPFHKEISDFDVALADGTSDEEYLESLDGFLSEHLEAVGADLVIYLAGADPYENDRLGRLSLTKTGLARRDQMVFSACARRGLPVALTMGGGYAPCVDDIVDIHERSILTALSFCRA